MAQYQKPPALFAKAINPLVSALVTRFGFGPSELMVLTVRGRKSGEPRSVPVNLMPFEGEEYLVSPRGDTEWVRNLRSARAATLQVKKDTRTISIVEVSDGEKAPLLREYLRRWSMQAGRQFSVSKDASDAELAAIASEHPVFRIIH